MINKIASKFYVYVAILLISVFSSFYYINFINKPRDEETISLYLSFDNLDTKELHNILEEHKPDYLREIEVFNLSPNDKQFDYFFVNRGINHADIFVLPTSRISEDFVSYQVAKLDEEYVSTYFTYESAYENTAIKMNKDDPSSDSLFNYKDSDYYIFYRKNSLHIGELNNCKYDTALLLTKVILQNA